MYADSRAAILERNFLLNDEGPRPVAEESHAFVQWTTDGNKYFPAGFSCDKLPIGIYETKIEPNHGPCLEKIDFSAKGLLVFPEAKKLLFDMQNFWSKKADFEKYDLAYKFGAFIYGGPGNGKTSAIKLVLQDLFDRGGICIKYTIPSLFVTCVRFLRQIQPDIPLIVLMEELDETIREFGEAETLNILDGQEVLENVIFIATTNYPESFSERFLNRPNRFAFKYKMGCPNKVSRKMFFEHVFQKYDGEPVDLDRWVKDTEGLSVDHLNHLFRNVIVFGHAYDAALSQLRQMDEEKVSSADDAQGMGFTKV